MKKPEATVLNQDQTRALEILKSDRNVFLSGAAGTGKSTLINYYKKHHNPQIEVLCSTGLASVLVGGRTFHSYFGIGIMNEPLEVILDRVMSNPAMVARILKAKTILIDEISMLPGKALDYADFICRSIRADKADQAFAGIRVIACGDFLQLPPVSKGNEPIDWSFKSLAWTALEMVEIDLREPMRTTDSYFLKVLASVRKGLVGPEVTKFLNSKIIKPEEIDSFVGTRIFARKADVAAYNEKKLNELKTPLVVFETDYEGNPSAVERLKRNLPIDDKILLKIGAFVMVRVNAGSGFGNDSKEKEYVNGTLGHVINIVGQHSVTIKTLDGRYINFKRHVFELKDGDGTVLARSSNVPLSVSYGVTIHRSQGSSVDRAIMDLRNLFTYSQAYTALSRMTNSEGLKIIGWDRRSIFVDPTVIEFYRKMNQKNKI